MLSAVITALLLCVMLLVIASLIINSLRERRRHMRSLAIQGHLPSHPFDHHVKMILYMQEGVVVGVEKPAPLPAFTHSSSWYGRHRTLVSISFLVMIFLTLFIQSGLADGALQNLGKSFSIFSNYQSSDIKALAHPLPFTASVRLVRIDSAVRSQYYSDYQWRVWSYSSCSGISMEEVMNAYGRHYIAADVLQVEQNLGVWDTYNGLLGGEPALAKVANYFGFKASPNPPRTLKDLINVVNKGFPVIVGMPGHIFVVRGGDSNYVYVADSSPANRTVLSYQDFTSIWNGFSVLITPQ
jgi:Peptidase_C39 like family